MARAAILVFACGLITALATGLGALPFAFLKQVSTRTRAYAGAVASGLMLGASFGLVAEGSSYGALQALAGAGLGVLFIFLAERYLVHRPDLGFGSFGGRGARQILLLINNHSVEEGKGHRQNEVESPVE